MLSTGLTSYVNTIKSKFVDNAYTTLVAFILSLTEEQMNQLQREQVSFHANSFLYISQEFVKNEIAKDVV